MRGYLEIFDQSFHIHGYGAGKGQDRPAAKKLSTRRKEGREERKKEKKRKKLPWGNLQVIQGCSLR